MRQTVKDASVQGAAVWSLPVLPQALHPEARSFDMQWLRVALLVSFGFVTPLLAQVVPSEPTSASETQGIGQTPPPDAEVGAGASEPMRKLRLMTEQTTQDFIAKFDSVGALTNSVIFEDSSTGKIGIGTTTPTMKLHVFGNEEAGTVIQAENTSAGSGAHATFRTVSPLSSTSYVAHGYRPSSLVRFGIPLAGWGELLNFNGNGYIIGTTPNTPLVFGTFNAERMRIAGNGNVGIGTTSPAAKLHVAGDVIVTGNVTGAKVIGAIYQDLAEWVPATSDMTPGTVVVLNLDRSNEVMPSSREYDTAVAGVVSTAPGIILGVAGESKEQIATTGRVKVRVDARTNPVRVGDLLVTSDIPGTAMRSEPMDMNGRKFHQPGTIIGKALEPLAGGVGEILVLLSMQ